MKILQFVPFTSCLDVGFLHDLTKNKLEVYGLDESPVSINGFYTNGDASELPPRLTVDYWAFHKVPQTPPRCFTMNGVMHIKNTLENFKICNKKELIDSLAHEIWRDILSGRAEVEPNILNQFFLLIFPDVKKYQFYYWFAFPAFLYPNETLLQKEPESLKDSYLKDKMEQLKDLIDEHKTTMKTGFFVLQLKQDNVTIHPLECFPSLYHEDGKLILGFCDPTTNPSHPGWPLRNLLTMAAVRWSHVTSEYEVLCLRDRVRNGKRDIGHSLLLTVRFEINKTIPDLPNCVGWEKNERQKLGPRMINLSNTMDPSKLADSSVDLNLKLMKWRLVPSLDLAKLKETKCLLLGSGTLGCNVARMLLGWGIRNITFVDNAQVSYSNPVRQSLFKFDDCLNGGKNKAEAAATALQDIFPGVNSKDVCLSIPMPGHIINENDVEQVKKDVKILEDLIESHDVVFLLMDTRESRWLPSVLAAAKGKLVINAALGFDTFLVMRHGIKIPDNNYSEAEFLEHGTRTSIPGNLLGCYFCNDVVAPGDSTRDRTLDQQCTVTRPGVSMIAAALAVELMASILQSPIGANVPAVTCSHDDHLTSEYSTVLGIVPHQIRGFLSSFYHVLPASVAFNKCTACSDIVISTLKSRGFEFLLQVFNQPSYLEDLTGLTELHNETQTAEVWELDDD